MSDPSAPIAKGDFFALIPRRAVLVFLSAVFFVFAPIGLLLSSTLSPVRPTPSLLLLGLVSGALAVCWAATFTVSRWFAPGIVVFTLALMALSGPLSMRLLGVRSVAPSQATVMVVGAIVAGYVLFVLFVNGQGRAALRLMTEMSLARSIHQTLVPPIRVSSESIEVYGVSSASTEMGGDLVDCVTHGTTTDLILADVSGHGVRAGVVMGMVKSALRMGLLEDDDLDELASKLNQVIETTTSSELYTTLGLVRIGSQRQSAECLLAGHHHILCYRAAERRIERLAAPALPIGLMPGASYRTRSIAVGPGDVLALYTDGLNETMDASDEELGHDAIEACLIDNVGGSLEQIQQALFRLTEAHGSQDDDRSVLLARFR